MVRTLAELAPIVAAKLRNFPDFPKPGILFRDVMPLLRDPALMDEISASVADRFRGKVDAVVALDARGFLFGPQIASQLKVPFAPIRKKGKLPGDCISASYLKEYGEDVFEIQKDALTENARVLVVDDLLATGGSLEAAVTLVTKAGAKVASIFVVVELEELKGRTRLPSDVEIVRLVN